MLRVLCLALAFAATQVRDAPPPLLLEIRAFDGPDEVTAETRVTVLRAGERADPVAQGTGRTGHLEIPVPPGIYDVQAIRETNGQVSSIRWAERLVVMAYPDEAGHHLEVVNFKSGFGALQIRSKASTSTPDVGIYVAAAHDKEAARRFDAPGYALFIIPAGRYDIQERADGRQLWHSDIDVPLDRTRLWIVPTRLDPPSREQPKHDDHERDHQQHMDQSPGHVQRETEQPQDQQQNDDRPEHAELPPAAFSAAGTTCANEVPRR